MPATCTWPRGTRRRSTITWIPMKAKNMPNKHTKNLGKCRKLKGPLHEIFDLWVLFSYPSGTLIHGPSRRLLRICANIWQYVTAAMRTAVSMMLLYHVQQCQWCYCIMDSSVNDATVSWTAVSMMLLYHGQLCQWCYCIMDSSVNDATVSWTAVSMMLLYHGQLCQWCYCIMDSSVNDATVSCTAVSMMLLYHVQQCQWCYYIMHSCVNDASISFAAQSKILLYQCYLKGPWHEIFDLWFFSSNNSP
jgi:hypothetical protein